MSKRIQEESHSPSKSFFGIPYVDPNKFDIQRSNNNSIRSNALNEKSDVYSVGILLWEISSGHPPFYTKAMKVSQGLRETTIFDTPEDFVKVYTGKFMI